MSDGAATLAFLRARLTSALLGLGLLLLAGCAPAPLHQPGDWKLVTSAHFRVRTDASAAAYRPVIERLELVHEALGTGFFPGVEMAPIDVLLFARVEDYAKIAPPNLVGFFTSALPRFPGGLLVLSAEGKSSEAVAATAAHELAHRFLYEVNERVPTWLHEGFAKYVGAIAIEPGRAVFDARSPRPATGELVPLARLVGTSSSDFHGADARAQYLTAWLVVRRLLENPDPAALARFHWLTARSALATTAAEQTAALEEAFAGKPLRTIERDVTAAHEALQSRQAHPRRTVVVRLRRRSPLPFAATAVDARAIAQLCGELAGSLPPR